MTLFPMIKLWSMKWFQDAVSPSMEMVSDIHDWILLLGVFVISIVLYVAMIALKAKSWNLNFFQSEPLELTWTLLPTLFLLLLMFPSLHSLYLMEENHDTVLNVKAIGHQWYWSYEISDWGVAVEFDSYLEPVSDYRLLDVNNSLVIPYNQNIRLTTTSTDVIHSWTIPSLGVKVDAVPGRINQSFLVSSKMGVLYGQCSEICGYMHSMMPIKLEVVPVEVFTKWLNYASSNL
nr:cytochrome c oxidase subunit 2 [Lepidophthirus macrorhini]